MIYAPPLFLDDAGVDKETFQRKFAPVPLLALFLSFLVFLVKNGALVDTETFLWLVWLDISFPVTGGFPVITEASLSDIGLDSDFLAAVVGTRDFNSFSGLAVVWSPVLPLFASSPISTGFVGLTWLLVVAVFSVFVSVKSSFCSEVPLINVVLLDVTLVDPRKHFSFSFARGNCSQFR